MATVPLSGGFSHQTVAPGARGRWTSGLPARLALPSGGRAAGQTRRHCQAVASGKFEAASVVVEEVKPQGDRLLVRLDEVAQASAGGVLLPSSAVKYEAYLSGKVISTGPEAKSVTPGQKVLFSDLNAYPVTLGTGEEKLCFVRDGDLVALVE